MAVLFLCELHDGSIGESAKERLWWLIGCKFDGSDFGFLSSFIDLFVGRGFVIDGLWREFERLKFDELHELNDKLSGFFK